MNVSVLNPTTEQSVPAHDEIVLGSLELSRVINVTFMSLLESPDLSCVYRVRPGDTARSIIELALTKRLQREPSNSEIEAYSAQVAAANDVNLANLRADEFIMLPIECKNARRPIRILKRHEPVADSTKSNSDVQCVIAPPGLGLSAGDCVLDASNIVASRSLAQPVVKDEQGTITYFYQGELSSSFLGLFRSFFSASETIDASKTLLHSRVDYDGFGASLNFMTISGEIALPLVRSVETKFDAQADVYQSVVTCADGVEHRLMTARDGKRSWRA